MELDSIITTLKDKFGDSFDVAAVTEKLKGMDTSNFSITEIISKVKDAGLLGDLDGDGVQEGFIEEIKGKIGSIFGK